MRPARRPGGRRRATARRRSPTACAPPRSTTTTRRRWRRRSRAPRRSCSSPAPSVGRRVAQHGRVIDAAKTAGVRRVVYTSAPHADTTELVLAPDHKATEELLTASGLAWTILRNNWYTENYVGAVEQARTTGVLLTSAGDGRVASASRDDYAAGAAAVLLGGDHDGRVYELSGDVAWSVDELAEAASVVLGTPVVAKQVSSDEHRAILVDAGLDEGTADFVATLDADIRRGDLADATSDLRTLLGRPTTPLVDGLRAALGR